MSNYETKPGSFSLFKNDKRNDQNNQPHYNGNGKDLNGNEFQVSAWVTTSKNGVQYFSCKMQEPYKKEERVNTPQPVANNSNNEDSGLPF